MPHLGRIPRSLGLSSATHRGRVGPATRRRCLVAIGLVLVGWYLVEAARKSPPRDLGSAFDHGTEAEGMRQGE
jgi:hypothetical protein